MIGIELGDWTASSTGEVRPGLALDRLRDRSDDVHEHECRVTNKTALSDTNDRAPNGRIHPQTPRNPPRWRV